MRDKNSYDGLYLALVSKLLNPMCAFYFIVD